MSSLTGPGAWTDVSVGCGVLVSRKAAAVDSVVPENLVVFGSGEAAGTNVDVAAEPLVIAMTSTNTTANTQRIALPEFGIRHLRL